MRARGAQVTDESWQGHDGVTQKGWLLRGATNSPAVILLHKYGANRSHVLNLGVKLNEATNFTVLMPDLRGHGAEAGDKICTFGGCESEDLTSTVAYLKGLKSPEGFQLIGGEVDPDVSGPTPIRSLVRIADIGCDRESARGRGGRSAAGGRLAALVR